MRQLQDIYIYCPNCKAKLIQKSEYKECSNCKRHYFFNPKPTVSIIISTTNNKLLLTKRAFEPYKDWWDIPGGFVNQGETLEEAAIRELYEETGLRPKSLTYVGSRVENYAYHDELHPVISVFFKGIILENSTIKVGDDVKDYKLVDKKQIDFKQIAFDNQRQFLTDYLKGI